MADGRVIMLKITHLAMEVKEEVLVDDPENPVAVTAIDMYDLCGEGRVELIIGRRDGTVQVYSMPSDDNMFDVENRLIYSEVHDRHHQTFTHTYHFVQFNSMSHHFVLS